MILGVLSRSSPVTCHLLLSSDWSAQLSLTPGQIRCLHCICAHVCEMLCGMTLYSHIQPSTVSSLQCFCALFVQMMFLCYAAHIWNKCRKCFGTLLCNSEWHRLTQRGDTVTGQKQRGTFSTDLSRWRHFLWMTFWLLLYNLQHISPMDLWNILKAYSYCLLFCAVYLLNLLLFPSTKAIFVQINISLIENTFFKWRELNSSSNLDAKLIVAIECWIIPKL